MTIAPEVGAIPVPDCGIFRSRLYPMSLKKDHRFMTGTHPVISEEEEQRVSRPSEEEILRWRRRGALRSALIYFVSPILLASAIGALAYITRPEAMPAHERMREMAREVQARRVQEAQEGATSAAGAAVSDAGVASRE